MDPGGWGLTRRHLGARFIILCCGWEVVKRLPKEMPFKGRSHDQMGIVQAEREAELRWEAKARLVCQVPGPRPLFPLGNA